MTEEELTHEDYMVLICAALCLDDPPVITRSRHEKLRKLGLVGHGVAVGDDHMVARTMPKGREVVLEYVQQHCEEEDLS